MHAGSPLRLAMEKSADDFRRLRAALQSEHADAVGAGRAVVRPHLRRGWLTGPHLRVCSRACICVHAQACAALRAGMHACMCVHACVRACM